MHHPSFPNTSRHLPTTPPATFQHVTLHLTTIDHSATGKRKGKAVILPFQLAVLIGIAITYVVVGGDNLAAFAGSITPPGGAKLGKWAYYLMFGGLQLFLSMVRRVYNSVAVCCGAVLECTRRVILQYCQLLRDSCAIQRGDAL